MGFDWVDREIKAAVRIGKNHLLIDLLASGDITQEVKDREFAKLMSEVNGEGEPVVVRLIGESEGKDD